MLTIDWIPDSKGPYRQDLFLRSDNWTWKSRLIHFLTCWITTLTVWNLTPIRSKFF